MMNFELDDLERCMIKFELDDFDKCLMNFELYDLDTFVPNEISKSYILDLIDSNHLSCFSMMMSRALAFNASMMP